MGRNVNPPPEPPPPPGLAATLAGRKRIGEMTADEYLKLVHDAHNALADTDRMGREIRDKIANGRRV
jgi:hypothetical protein